MFNLSEDFVFRIFMLLLIGFALPLSFMQYIKYMFRKATLHNKENYDKEEYDFLMRLFK